MDLEQRIDEALFRQLISFSPIPLIGSTVGSLLVSLAQLPSDKSHLIFSWLGLVYVVAIFRVWLTFRAKNKLESRGYEPTEAFRYSLTTAFSGIAWGLGAFLMKDAAATTVIIVTISTQAMIMGGILTLARFTPAFFAFSIPAIIPLTLVFAMNGGKVNLILAFYSITFFVLMSCLALQFNQYLRNACRITLENEDLIKSLTEANHKILMQNKVLDHAAHHDPLTGLPNRMLLTNRMEQVIAMAQKYAREVAVLYIDLDGFKPINDKLGHDAGDTALLEVSKRLGKTINSGDTLARVGGDEFVILLYDLNDDPIEQNNNIKELAELIANKCLAVFQTPFVINGQSCKLGASIGLAISKKGISPSLLLAAADMAMYQAKASRSGGTAWADL